MVIGISKSVKGDVYDTLLKEKVKQPHRIDYRSSEK